ncbi:hypothetical protein [Nocardiopsis ansamitocini]|uniref:Integral membrane protein n=1 Tax=Nocardiopsis ansamitocini TaxID=1670832 RepID=A0A9W6P432_9ACTN|nr:hypothetical protein [Nocardiopsis ansamitocini]GLU46722.1 hypothetical protein Nans01_10730 [Nocardiopsis ansamitocini]
MSRRPFTIVIAAVLEGLLGLALLGSGVFILFSALMGNSADITYALPLAVFALGAAAALGYVAWGLFELHEWARSPVVLTQLFALIVAYYLWTSQQPVLSLALGGVAAAALAAVLAPATTATLFPAQDPPPRGGRKND